MLLSTTAIVQETNGSLGLRLEFAILLAHYGRVWRSRVL